MGKTAQQELKPKPLLLISCVAPFPILGLQEVRAEKEEVQYSQTLKPNQLAFSLPFLSGKRTDGWRLSIF